MRVLVAVDASDGSYTAAQLVHTMRWPPGSIIRLISVAEPGGWIPPGPNVPLTGGLVGEHEVGAYLLGQQLGIVDDFSDTDLPIETTVVTARPGDAIVDEAKRFDADVVVVGSRGHGKIGSLLLGSVSAEVVDRAQCPVLVARRSGLRRTILAVDGSTTARTAAHLITSWPAFEGVPIRVVAVAEPARPWAVAAVPAFLAQWRRPDTAERQDPLVEASDIAADAVAGLRAANREAEADVRRGRPAEQVVAAAREHDADMVVVGCRGRSAVSNIVLGSVARDVVLAGDASVLVVRNSAAGRGR